jgi:hypothetical protein
MKKSLILSIFVILMFSLVSVSAINLKIEKTPVSDVVLSKITQPAVFDFTITNLGESDNFEIYSLVSGIDISPKGTFQIAGGQVKNIQVQFFPDENFKKRPGIVTFSYKIRGQDTGIQEDTITLAISDLEEALAITVDNINPESDQATVSFENKVNFDFSEIKVDLESAFFSSQQTISLKGLERKSITIPINRATMSKLVAGQYILTTKLSVGDVKQSYESIIKFTEKSGLSTKQTTSGILLRERTIEKTNEGNIPTVAEISFKKDIVSRLFTTFNIKPDSANRANIVVSYSWQKELKPGESLIITARTNYFYPLLIIIIILIGVALIRIYTLEDLVLEKRVGYVKTKGGEFALKVTIVAKARRYIHKVSIVDRLPAIVKLYEKFGTYAPNRHDPRTGRLEWDIESLQPGEERIFSYIVYSKMGVVGRFELPSATAIYEKEGKVRESSSNRAFFMNEPRKAEE